MSDACRLHGPQFWCNACLPARDAEHAAAIKRINAPCETCQTFNAERQEAEERATAARMDADESRRHLDRALALLRNAPISGSRYWNEMRRAFLAAHAHSTTSE